MSEQAVPIYRHACRCFVRGVKDFLRSEVGGRALGLGALLLVLLLAINGLNVVNSYVGRNFMTAISDRDGAGFVRQAIFYVGVFAGSTVVLVLQTFAQQRLALLWRAWLTGRLVTSYLTDRSYYWLKERGAVANPDERLADDVNTFTTTALSFVLIFLNGTFTVLAFAGVLWTISRLLFAVAVGYAVFGSLMTILLGRPLVRLNYQQLDREANFRSALVQLQEHADSVALMRWEGRLTARLLRRLDDLVANFRRITSINRNLGFFTTGYNYLIQIIPLVIVAPLYIRNEVEFGVVTQSAMAFSQLLGAFSLIVNQFQSISSFAAVVARVDGLVAAVEGPAVPEPPAIKTIEDRDRVAYEHLTLQEPNSADPLVQELSVSLPRGMRVLVTGPNEAARVSLLRATAGIWHGGEGTVTRPPLDEILFLPERPYLPPGTLREILLAPGQQAGDEHILAALHAAGLETLGERAGGLDRERDWEAFLSFGEQQRLAVTRVLLAEPRFAFLDRVASALGAEPAQRVLQLLTKHSITPVHLAGTGESSDAYDAVVVIGSDGAWTWRPTDATPGEAREGQRP